MSEQELTWQHTSINPDVWYLTGAYGHVAKIMRLSSGRYAWGVLRYQMSTGITPTYEMAQTAAEAAWKRCAAWIASEGLPL